MAGNAFEILATDDSVQEFACGPTKICKVCQVEKPLAEFHKNRGRADGHRNTCKSCRRVSNSNGISREEIVQAVAAQIILRLGL